MGVILVNIIERGKQQDGQFYLYIISYYNCIYNGNINNYSKIQ